MSAPGWGVAPWRIQRAIVQQALPTACDVLVVGAGLTGLTAAYRLARRGVSRIVVVESSHVGAGASGRTGGIVLEGTVLGPLDEVDDCIGALHRLVGEVGIDCGLRLGGCWELEHGKPDPPFLWRDGDCALRVCKTVPGGTLDPGALLVGLAAAALEAGATIHEGVPVRRIETGTPVQVRVGEATVTAAHVLVATNAYASSLLPLLNECQPALALAVCTEPLGLPALTAIGLASGMPFYTVDLPYLWGRSLADGRVIVGAGLAFAQRGELLTLKISEGEAAANLDSLERRVRALHPALFRVEIGARWGGPIALVYGRPPFLGWHPAGPGVLVAGGYNGHGVALSIRAGELAAAAIADELPLPDWGALRRGGTDQGPVRFR